LISFNIFSYLSWYENCLNQENGKKSGGEIMETRLLLVMRFFLALCLVAMFAGLVLISPSLACSGPTIEGCPIFPEDNVWNTPIDNLPVDPRSASFVETIGADEPVHPDFGSGTWEGGPIGIPYTIVPGTQPKVDVTFYYAEESDPGPYPIPPDAAIEGGSESDGDRHVLILDRDNCILYELYSAYPQPDGSWHAGSGAIFELESNALRPSGWTSADAAGLPILPGLVRYEEIEAGEIRHAVRFTVPETRREFIWPARHYASSLTELNYPPMGQRFRLKADFDISEFSPEVQVILRALKKYGMILADNGAPWYISGVPDERWNNDILVNELKRVKGLDFEAVDESSLMVDPDSGQAVQPPGPDISVEPESHDFERVYVGRSSEAQVFTISNIGEADLNIDTVFLKGEHADQFAIQNDDCSGQTIPPSGSCTLEVVFSPSSTGCKSAYLKIRSNDPDTPLYCVELSGLASPPITVAIPNGGENWRMGVTQRIQWRYTGNPGASVKILLLKNGVVHRTIKTSTPAGSGGAGSCNWQIPADLAPATDYKIRVRSTSNGSYIDHSNRCFTIRR
jgi:hypothetical protein